MTIQAATRRATARSALMFAAALVAASVAGSSASYAASNSVFPDPPQMSAPAPSDNAAAAPATTDANAALADQQQVEQQATPSPLAGSAVADSTDAAAATDAAANTAAVSNDDNSGWDKASIIGKIFIACGTLLTLGSAARMFMI